MPKLLSVFGFALIFFAAQGDAQSTGDTSRAFDTAFLNVSNVPPLFLPAVHFDALFAISSPAKPVDLVSRPAMQLDIQVLANDQTINTEELTSKSFTSAMVEASAGSFGDPLRYLQTVAGVTAGNDQRNDFILRGGNPDENGFVIDNIEVPSINQLALSDTTGGLVSMLDTTSIEQMTLHSDVYDSRFDERLSSIFEISTRPSGPVARHNSLEMNVAGLGWSMSRRLAGANVFVSARQSVLQWVTNDIGMNGVPHYRNAFLRADGGSGNNSWWGMSLTGIDSVQIRPSATDGDETNPYDIDYSGWRNTTGMNWQHVFSARTYGVASVAQAEQSQDVSEDAQLANDALAYSEKSRDAITTLKYDWTTLMKPWLTVQAGARSAVDQLHYVVGQPIGLQNPYSSSPAALNAMASDHQFSTVSTGAYAEASARLPHGLELGSGLRIMQWALGGHERVTGRVTLSKTLAGRILEVGYAEHAQMPPALYLLSFDNLKTLKPVASRDLTASALLVDNMRTRVTVAAYQKRYSDYPVAQQYPQLSLANIADTFGQAFLMFPMVGSGTGVARGVELTGQIHLTTKIEMAQTLTYSRSWYAGLDGVLRKSNYDFPVVANTTGTWMLPHSLVLAWRYTLTSGTPYTPDNIALSIAQNRDVYDLAKINNSRSSVYQRLDFSVSQEHKLGRGTMTWRAGLLNAMNNKNFYCDLWEPHASAATAQAAQSIQYQMSLFPEGGIKYTF